MSYIFNEKPKIIQYDMDYIEFLEEKVKSKEELSEDEVKYLLDYVCFTTRSKFTDDIENFNFLYKCDVAQAIICYYFSDLDVVSHPCMTQNVITNDIVGHSFTVIELNHKYYLIDPTYRQFTLEENCRESNYILYKNNMIIRTPDPGYFIKEEDKPEISSFLIDGYHELDEDFARIYGDSFYNTKTGNYDNSFKSIPGKVYMNSFFKGNEILSKTKEELESSNLLIKSSNKKI